MQHYNIYQPIPNINIYDSLELVDDISDEEILDILHFLGYPHRLDRPPKEWRPPLVKIKPGQKPGDFPSFIGYHLVFSERAFNLLYPLMEGSIIPLKILCISGEKYITVRVIKLLDCLDHSLSEIDRFENGKLRDVKTYTFKHKIIGDSNIFRLPEHHRILVAQKFKDWVERHELEGLIFRLLTSRSRSNL